MRHKFKFALAVLSLLTAMALVLAVPTEAGVVSPSVSSGGAAQADGLVTKVHGCHRGARIGPWTGVRHRHVGPFCVWKKVGNACGRWRRICRERCYDARRPGRCKRRCYFNNAPPRCH